MRYPLLARIVTSVCLALTAAAPAAFSDGEKGLEAVTPAGGEALFAQATIRPLEVSGLGTCTERADEKDAAVPGGDVLKVVVTKKPELTYQAQVQWLFEKPVKKGDVLLATFLARGTGTLGRQPIMEPILGQYGGRWLNFAVLSASPTPQWQRYYLRAIAAEDYPAKEARLSINLGFAPQTVEFADVSAWNFGSKLVLNDLPTTRLTYKGREADAAWRVEAARRIEAIRKSDLRVRVVDGQGKPLAGATVVVQQTAREFKFGTAMSPFNWSKPDPEHAKYREVGMKYFDSFTVEWETMWANWVNPGAQDVIIATAKEVVAAGKLLHGCHLQWGSKDNLPPDIRPLSLPSEEIRTRMRAHNAEKLEALRGLATTWNAVNEPWPEHLLWDRVGKAEMAETFRQARAIDPHVTLDLNDYGDMANWNQDHVEGYLALAKELIASGAPVDRVGLQCHFGSSVRGPEEIFAMLDRFAALGKPIHISELDINCSDDEFQADFLRDVLTVLYSHPAVVQITQWGYWEGNHWLPSGALWRRDWSEKPSGTAYRKLLEETWHTEARLESDADGQAATRGFLGTYVVTATVGGRSTTQTVALSHAGADVTLTLK